MKSVFKVLYQAGITQDTSPPTFRPDHDRVWLFLSADVMLIEDQTTTGVRWCALKIQDRNYGFFSNAFLGLAGDDLTTAGTGTKNIYSHGSLTRPKMLGNTYLSGTLGISGLYSTFMGYNKPVPVMPGSEVSVNVDLLGSDTVTIYAQYVDMDLQDYMEKVI